MRSKSRYQSDQRGMRTAELLNIIAKMAQLQSLNVSTAKGVFLIVDYELLFGFYITRFPSRFLGMHCNHVIDHFRHNAISSPSLLVSPRESTKARYLVQQGMFSNLISLQVRIPSHLIKELEPCLSPERFSEDDVTSLRYHDFHSIFKYDL